MKAIAQDRYGGPDALTLREVDAPTPADGEVLVRVHAASLNAADWHISRGKPYVGRVAMGLRRPKDPIRGIDLAGVVEAVGVNVARFRPGDEVFGAAHGSLAEFAATPERRLAPKPRGLTFEQAAALPAAGCTAL